MTEKKKRPSARRSPKTSKPPYEEIFEKAETAETVELHPLYWVTCFGCQNEAQQERGKDGRHRLPRGWVTIFRTNRESKDEDPDVYASESCAQLAVKRLRRIVESSREPVTVERQAEEE